MLPYYIRSYTAQTEGLLNVDGHPSLALRYRICKEEFNGILNIHDKEYCLQKTHFWSEFKTEEIRSVFNALHFEAQKPKTHPFCRYILHAVAYHIYKESSLKKGLSALIITIKLDNWFFENLLDALRVEYQNTKLIDKTLAEELEPYKDIHNHAYSKIKGRALLMTSIKRIRSILLEFPELIDCDHLSALNNEWKALSCKIAKKKDVFTTSVSLELDYFHRKILPHTSLKHNMKAKDKLDYLSVFEKFSKTIISMIDLNIESKYDQLNPALGKALYFQLSVALRNSNTVEQLKTKLAPIIKSELLHELSKVNLPAAMPTPPAGFADLQPLYEKIRDVKSTLVHLIGMRVLDNPFAQNEMRDLLPLIFEKYLDVIVSQ